MKQHELPIVNIKLLKRKSLLAIVTNSIKNQNYFFKNLYAKDDSGNEIDILNDGRNSCGVFVSWILLALELIRKPHASVLGTEKDLLESGWYEIKDLKPGAILVWEKTKARDKFIDKHYDDLELRHIGFYVGNDEAISNSSNDTGFPNKHHYTYNNTRKIEKIYWHPELD